MNPTLIIAILEALPALLQAVPRIANLMERFLKFVDQHDLNQWMDEVEKGINQLEKAQTPDEKLAAAHILIGAIRHV